MSREENIAVFQDTCQYFEKPFFARVDTGIVKESEDYL